MVTAHVVGAFVPMDGVVQHAPLKIVDALVFAEIMEPAMTTLDNVSVIRIGREPFAKTG